MSQDWKQKAACKNQPLSWFFEDYESNNEIQLKVDKICSSCHVRLECLEYAIENNVEGGVFGRKYFELNKKPKRKQKI